MHAIVFDIDGTLTRSNRVDSQCFLQALKTVFGTDEINTDWSQYQHVTDEGIIQELYPGISAQKRNAFRAEFVALLELQSPSEYQEIDGASEFLSLLLSSGYPVAMATGAWRESAEIKLRKSGIDFPEIPLASSSDAISRIEIMRRAVGRLSQDDFDAITYFGDGSWDVKATKELGWNFVGIGSQIHHLESLGAVHTFSEYTEPNRILEVLEQSQY